MKYRWVQNNIEDWRFMMINSSRVQDLHHLLKRDRPIRNFDFVSRAHAQTFSAEVPSLALLKVEVALPLLKNAEHVKE